MSPPHSCLAAVTSNHSLDRPPLKQPAGVVQLAHPRDREQRQARAAGGMAEPGKQFGENGVKVVFGSANYGGTIATDTPPPTQYPEALQLLASHGIVDVR